MNIKYYNKSSGIISEIESDGIRVPFYTDMDYVLYYIKDDREIPVYLKENNGIYEGEEEEVSYSLEHIVNDDVLTLKVKIKNNSDSDFTPQSIGFRIGIDSYMVAYPQWNDKFFPSYLRCEKTHFTGYFMSPLGKMAIVTCENPVAAWELEYNKWGTEDEMNCHFGHRIYTADLLLTVNGKLNLPETIVL